MSLYKAAEYILANPHVSYKEAGEIFGFHPATIQKRVKADYPELKKVKKNMERILRNQRIRDWVRANPDCLVRDVMAQFKLSENTIRQAMGDMKFKKRYKSRPKPLVFKEQEFKIERNVYDSKNADIYWKKVYKEGKL
jgi:hypothetical protein